MLSENLYVEILAEELRPDPLVPGGYFRLVFPSGKCAVFDEKELDELIAKTKQKLRALRKLRKEAEAHSTLMDEAYLRSPEVPFKMKRLVKKVV